MFSFLWFSHPNDENGNRIKSLMCELLTSVSLVIEFLDGGSKLFRFLAKDQHGQRKSGNYYVKEKIKNVWMILDIEN